MGFDLNSMTGKYRDFARNYLFYATIDPAPVALGEGHPYLVSAASLPTHTIEPLTTNWQGMQYKIGATHTYAEYSITFKSDPEQALRAKFIEWMGKVHNPVTNIHGLPGGPNTAAGYFGAVNLSQINGQGTRIMDYKFFGAWPSSVAEISLDYGSKEISTFAVTFTYQYFTTNSLYGPTDSATGAVPK